MTDKKYYVTTPIYYISGSPHLGHLYTTVAADIMARYKKMQGFKVLFATGSDENSLKVVKAAEKAHMDPKMFVDQEAVKWTEFFKRFSIDFSRFIRTTDSDHIKTVQKVLHQLHDKGYVYKGKYEGLYCVDCETFWVEADIKEQICPSCGREVHWISEDNYFFKLSAFEKPLLEFYSQHPESIEPVSRYNEIVSTIKMGLRDISISRSSQSWGIPFPFDEKHVTYVWFDALINYITMCGYEAKPENFQEFWPADLHLMSKDIIRFHCIIWPAMLMALEVPLAKKVFVHGWWLTSGEKMSKSKGNIIDPDEVVKDLCCKTGIPRLMAVDILRLFMFRESSFGDDAVFTDDRFYSRYNFDLANDLGNLINRVYAMAHKNFNGKVPEKTIWDSAFHQEIDQLIEQYHGALEHYHFKEALELLWALINKCNKLIETSKPWELKKNQEEEKLRALIYTLLDAIRRIAYLIYPFMPNFAEELLKSLCEKLVPMADLSFGSLPSGITVNQTGVLFPRIKTFQCDSVPEDTTKEAETPEISYEDFAKIDFRVAEVLEASKVEKSDKLLLLKLKVGNCEKQVVAGIALHYEPSALIGKKLVIVNNLKPVKLRGVMSQGMIMAASNDEILSIITTEKDIESGAKVK